MQESQSSAVERGGSSRTLEKYKKRLLFQVVAIFSICLLVILERIFYQVIIEKEQDVLANLQLSSDLVKQDESGIIPQQISSAFLRFFGSLSQFKVQFLLLTHLFITMYVAFDAFLTSKVLYVTMALIYLVSLLQLFYAGARPFWASDSVLTSSCLPNYSHPTLGLVLLLFVGYYTFYCIKKRAGGVFAGGSSTKELILGVISFVVIGVIQFITYFTGGVYLVSIGLAVVCFLLVMMVVISINGLIDKAIRKSTLIKVDAKKYVFYWLLFICLLETFALIVYSGQDVFLDIDWVKNYISCTKYLDYDQTSYRYDEVIGPWFNFLQTAALFAWIGAIFGISACYRKMKIAEWGEGPARKRLLRAVVSNLFIIPSWLFVLLLEEGSWVRDIGLNAFIVDCVHYFVLYLWLFGYMPVFVLERGLKLTNADNEDFYVILQEKGEKK